MSGETVRDHPFVGVAGHPDDDECTHRADGTDATYCGRPEAAHESSDPYPLWSSGARPAKAVTGEIITSAAELDALPVGSVVADSVARLLRTSTSSVHPTEPGPWVDEFGQFFESSRVIPDGEPLTVLYRPDRPFGVTVSDESSAFDTLGEWQEWANGLASLLPEGYDDDIAQEAIIEGFVREWAPVAEALDAARAADNYDGDRPILMRWDQEQQTLVVVPPPTVSDGDREALADEAMRREIATFIATRDMTAEMVGFLSRVDRALASRPQAAPSDLRRGLVVSARDLGSPGADEPDVTEITVEVSPTGVFREGELVWLTTVPPPEPESSEVPF